MVACKVSSWPACTGFGPTAITCAVTSIGCGVSLAVGGTGRGVSVLVGGLTVSVADGGSGVLVSAGGTGVFVGEGLATIPALTVRLLSPAANTIGPVMPLAGSAAEPLP